MLAFRKASMAFAAVGLVVSRRSIASGSVTMGRLIEQANRRDRHAKVIGEEQARIRQNMVQLDRTTDLYKRYVTKFTTQEDKIEQLRGQVEQLTEQEIARRKALDDYLAKLTLE
jgi:hypothetical protein